MKRKAYSTFFIPILLIALSSSAGEVSTAHVNNFYDLSPQEQSQVNRYEHQQAQLRALKSVEVPQNNFSKLPKKVQTVIAQDDMQTF